MGRFNFEDSERYGTSGGTKWFSLKNDGDIARVRYLYKGIEDVEGYAVHKVKLPDGKEVTVNCLRNYNDPLDVCPLCAARNPQKALYYIPLYDEDTQTVKFWQRGKSYGSELSSLCARFAKDGPLVNHIFEIERHGKAGDNKTTYKSFEVESDDTTIEDLVDELPQVIGTLILDKSAEDMEYYLDNGVFPEDSTTPTRRSSRAEEEYPRRNSEISRRTPARRTPNDRF